MREGTTVIWLEYLSRHHGDKLGIGVYTSKEEAVEAVGRLSTKPGFISDPSRFRAASYKVDWAYPSEPPRETPSALSGDRSATPLARAPELFCLWYSEDPLQLGPAKLVGVFSTRDKAAAAKARLAEEGGYPTEAEHWPLDAYTIDDDNWTSGFATID